MITMTLAEFQAAVKAQGEPLRRVKFICPMCRTPQCAEDFIEAGAGRTFEEVEKFVGFSCVGRFTDAPAPRREPDGKPCNWSLGGLLRMHELEVITPDGQKHPHFEVHNETA